MKNIQPLKSKITGLSLFLILLFTGISLHAQKQGSKKDKQKIHLKITEEKNGKIISVDTVYSPEQQPAISAYLKSLGLSAPDPVPPPPPLPPTAPPAPGFPVPPAPPTAPTPPESFEFNDSDIILHLNEKKISQEMRKEIELEIQKLKEEMKDFEMPPLPDFSRQDFHIKLDSIIFNKQEMLELEKKMENLKEELNQLQDQLKNIKIEIREKENDNGDGKEKSYFFNFDINTPYSYAWRFDKDESGENKADRLITKRILVLSDESDMDTVIAGYCCFKKNNKSTDKEAIGKVKVIKESKHYIEENKKEENSQNKNDSQDKINSYALQPEKFNLYPNPADGLFNLTFQLPDKEPVRVKIMDTSGKLIYDEYIENFNGTYQNQIQISEKGKGIYLLSISQGSRWMHKKIAVK